MKIDADRQHTNSDIINGLSTNSPLSAGRLVKGVGGGGGEWTLVWGILGKSQERWKGKSKYADGKGERGLNV